MRRFLGLLLLGGLWIGHPSTANAQVALSLGGPFGGRVGISVGSNYGLYGNGYYPYGYYRSVSPWYSSSYGIGPGTSYYNSGYYGYNSGLSYYGYAPGASYYSSGYYGGYPSYSYSYGSPSYGYPSYGYPSYGYPSYGYAPLGSYGWRSGLGGWGYW